MRRSTGRTTRTTRSTTPHPQCRARAAPRAHHVQGDDFIVDDDDADDDDADVSEAGPARKRSKAASGTVRPKSSAKAGPGKKVAASPRKRKELSVRERLMKKLGL